jgi:hypothetical protein
MSASLPSVQFIRGTIGSGGEANLADDVLWVQGLLNRWLSTRTKPALGLDGGLGGSTHQALVDFQREVVKLAQPNGKVAPGDATATKLLALRPQALRVRTGTNFVSFADGVSLDSTLLNRTLRLCQCALDCGLASYASMRQGVRSPKVAHVWSTSWNIREGRVPLSALQGLKDGKDLDGNLWYEKDWEAGLAKDGKGTLTPTALKALWQKIKANARTLYDSDAVAAEGYKISDPRIRPNAHRAVSNHTGGRAVDIAIGWLAGAKAFGMAISNGENTDPAVNRLVRAFDLVRPVASERWHFQLPVDASKGVSGSNNMRAGSHPPPR